MDSDLESLLIHATEKENRLTKIETTLSQHDSLMKELKASMTDMTNWFRILASTIMGGTIVAGIITVLKWNH